eukprot:TRINITY_DN7917_c0_g4_i2.p1 TRINITY_DN7917_c0_g4~~TRINITY_DN7917_c0_g4_i2.p1  ORF type:complete len:233 (+),score=38.48 TRINITY_DN7917_c0_g4_i2:119-817(+)
MLHWICLTSKQRCGVYRRGLKKVKTRLCALTVRIFNRRIELVMSKHSELLAKIKSAKLACEKKAHEIQSISNKLKEAIKDNGKLRNRIRAIQKENSQRNDEVAKIKKKLEEAEKLSSKCKGTVYDLSTRLKSLNNEQNYTKELLKDSQAQLKKSDSLLQIADKNKMNLASRLKKLQEDIRRMAPILNNAKRVFQEKFDKLSEMFVEANSLMFEKIEKEFKAARNKDIICSMV